MRASAFQNLIKGHYCWGCGTLNEHGLKIKSYWSGDEAICKWKPSPHHMAGPKSVLNGGIIAAIIDCHSVCTAIATAYKVENREIGSEPPFWYVTGSLSIRYLRPTSIYEEVILRASVMEISGKKTSLSCTLFSMEKECANADVVAVRVPPTWVDHLNV